jgi:hypothetical protein
MDADRRHQAVAQANGMADNVQVAIGDGVKGAGVERDTGHETVLPRSDRPRKRDGVRGLDLTAKPSISLGH